jgi:RNA polymerase sigma-70 factor (ECF subfamily)
LDVTFSATRSIRIPNFLSLVMKPLRCGVYSAHSDRIDLMEPPIPLRSNPWKRSVTPREDLHRGGDEGDDRESEGQFLTPISVEALFRQSYTSIVQALTLAGGNQAAAEDATQEAFAQAWARWGRISRYDNPGAWVRRVAINKMRNAHRSRLRGEAALQRMNSEISTATSPSESESDLVLGLQRLPNKQRLCAVLYYVDGLSTAEVAQAMGISQGSVSQHLNRARTALRAQLEGTA